MVDCFFLGLFPVAVNFWGILGLVSTQGSHKGTANWDVNIIINRYEYATVNTFSEKILELNIQSLRAL